MSIERAKTFATWCEKHERYHHPDEPCPYCHITELKQALEKAERQIIEYENRVQPLPFPKEN